MFANFLPFRNRSSSASADAGFVRDLRVHQPVRRNRRSERWIVLGWALIGLKSWGTFWLVARYEMPFNPWWIVLPTIFAAAVCTWIYCRRN